MFKIGDRVRYLGPCTTKYRKWAYKREGIIVEIDGTMRRIMYKKKHGLNIFYFYTTKHLKHIIPEYIKDWKKKLDHNM